MSGKNDTKHTPGPWHCDDVHPDSGSIMIGSAKDWVCVMCHKPDDYAAERGDDEENERQTLSNARLIAAAPELLEALKNLVAAYDSAIHDEYDGTEMLSCLLGEADSARAAIAKAEGFQPV